MIDTFIQKKRTGTPKQFARKLGICRSVLFEHITDMKQIGFPIKYSRSRETYYYEWEVASVPDLHTLTRGEMNAMKGGAAELPILEMHSFSDSRKTG